jgi:hypothetical protein
MQGEDDYTGAFTGRPSPGTISTYKHIQVYILSKMNEYRFSSGGTVLQLLTHIQGYILSKMNE